MMIVVALGVLGDPADERARLVARAARARCSGPLLGARRGGGSAVGEGDDEAGAAARQELRGEVARPLGKVAHLAVVSRLQPTGEVAAPFGEGLQGEDAGGSATPREGAFEQALRELLRIGRT